MVGVMKSITTAMVALAVASVVHADMMPISPPEGGARWTQCACVQTALGQPSDSQGSTTFRSTIGWDLLPVGFSPDVNRLAGDVAPEKPAQILMDRQDSLTLCLYALLGLGLCRSAPLIKKFHLGCIPDWYHSGGPSQIGHSFVLSPDCHITALAFCFIQPEPTAATQDLLPQRRRGIVVSLWRQSQFTLSVLASRGPPSLS